MRLERPARRGYAVRAMLSLAAHDGIGWLSVARISAAMDIPERFLPRVMTDLVRSGLVEGISGGPAATGSLARRRRSRCSR